MKKTNYLFWFLLSFIFLFGLYLRIKGFLYNRPLWHDECSLALSIIDRNIFDYFGLLEHNQSAPPLFMISVKLCTLLFNIKEYSLRLIPFLCGILSIPAFYFFSRLFSDNKLYLLLVNFLFAVNYNLIYYTQEFKQYSSDVLIFMLGIIFFAKADIKNLSDKQFLCIGFLFGILSLFSIPASFINLGFLLFLLITYKKAALKKLLFFAIPVAILWCAYIKLVILPQHAQKLIMDGSYWDKGFLTFNLTQILALIKMNLNYFLHPNKAVLLQIILVITGLYYLIKNSKRHLTVILLCTFTFIISASILGLYPIYERVGLYLIPVVLVLLALPLNYINKKYYMASFFISILLIFSFFNYNLSYFQTLLGKNVFTCNNARSTMQTLINKYNSSNSPIIVNAASDSEFKYYKKYFNFNPENVIFMQLPAYSKENYFAAMDLLPKNDYWFYFAYDYSHSPLIPFLKEWSKKHSVLYETEVDGAYLLYLKK